MQILLRYRYLRLRLTHRSLRLRVGGARRIAFTHRERAVGGQIFDALQIEAPLQRLRSGVLQRGLITGDGGFRAAALLQVVAECRLLLRQLRLRLMHALTIDAIVDGHQQLPFSHRLKIHDLHRGEIAIDLRADKGHLAAHVGVLSTLYGAGEGPELPGV